MGRKRSYVDIVDPVHGFIRAYGHELAVIDDPIFQRLRRIRQLSGAHLTYPAAQHTRFEHSLGVMHIASQAAHTLREKGIIKQDEVDVLRLAGLLHDVGHGPFSHIFEEIAQKRISHEDYGREIVTRSEIADRLAEWGFDGRLVAGIAFDDYRKQYMSEVISGVLSADIMDYLHRDSYFTGAEHAKINHMRLTHSLDVHGGRLALERSALYSFESMMHSRYQMFKAVYCHKTVRAAEMMMLEALRLSDGEFGFTTLNPNEYVRLTDEHVLSMLISSKSPGLRRARQFAQDYRDRRLIKCVFERILTGRAGGRRAKTDEIREDISKRSGIDESEIFVDSLVAPAIPIAPSKTESKSIILMTGGNARRTAREMQISEMPSVSAISGFMNILRVYTGHKNRKKAEIASRSVLGDLK